MSSCKTTVSSSGCSLRRRVTVAGVAAATVAGCLAGLPGPAAAAPVKSAVPVHSAADLASAPLLTTPALGALAGAGERPGDQFISTQVGDRVVARVNVGTGNLLVEASDFTLPGVSAKVTLGESYNSVAVDPSSPYQKGRLAWGWTDQGTDIRLIVNADGTVTYLAPTGAAFTCSPSDSTGDYACPTLKAELHNVTSEWRLRADGGATTLHFSATTGRLTGIADRNGFTTSFSEAPDHSSITVTSPAGPNGANTVTEVLNTDGTIDHLTQTGANGTVRTVSYNYSSAGDLAAIIDAAGRKTRFVYTNHLLTKIVNTGGFATTFTYDSSNRLATVTQVDPNGPNATTGFLYPSATSTEMASPDRYGSVPNVDPVDGVPHTTYTVNSTGRVTARTDPLGHTWTQRYTKWDDVSYADNPWGGSMTNTFDTDTTHDSKSITNSQLSLGSTSGPSRSWSYGGDYAFLPDYTTDFSGVKTHNIYDKPNAGGVGNLLGAEDSASAAQANVAYSNGLIHSSTDPNNVATATKAENPTLYDYTSNELSTVTPPTGSGQLGVKHITYDEFGRIATTKTDGAGNLATYSYDALDRLTSISYTDGTPTVSYTYDDAGNLATRTDASGTTTYGYNSRGLLTSKTATAGIDQSVSYSYDLDGNLASVTDAHGTVTYTYDDPRDLLTSMTTADGKLINFGYDRDDNRIDTWYGTNTTNTAWTAHVYAPHDQLDRVDRIKVATDTAATVVSDVAYSYNSAPQADCPAQPATPADQNRLGTRTDNLTQAVTEYCYGGSGRLGQALNLNGHDYSYAYDADGNRKSVTIDGVSKQTLTFDAANQINNSDGSYGYDPAGNLTTQPGLDHVGPYNSANQLTAVNPTGGTKQTYNYAGSDNLERVQAGGSAEAYTVKGQGGQLQLGAYQPAGDPAVAYIERDPNGAPEVLVWHGNDYYLMPDNLGSITALVDTSGNVTASYSYDPWGNITATSGTLAGANLIRFTGGEYDPTSGYTKLGVRYYDPNTGRFTQPDTIVRLADPINGNLYAYAGDSPGTYVDPTGQSYAISYAINGAKYGAIIGGAIGCTTGGIGGAIIGSGAGPVGTAGGIVAGCVTTGEQVGTDAGFLGGFGGLVVGGARDAYNAISSLF